ncbi:MAG: UDP-N-acetylmuramoyl-L-alanyl-D-glutamate--2,6-diaminopimelate ligase [Deltaproteobacteria bacterium]|nr:UDP-N-acetylmuramoyl-L-alanyl-D-glutamate--2,6-diaminopimelate ligase [Deltaproteobacteria bacterium]
MELRDLVQDLAQRQIVGDDGVPVRGVKEDSRDVNPGDVFVAVRGRTADGHDFARLAVERGASAAVAERQLPIAVPQVIVPSSARALGWLAARIAGRPSDRMTVVGVTGTNGKTTTTYLLESILRAADQRPGVIGTVNYRFAGKEVPAPFTTPTPVPLHQLFAQMNEAGCTHVVTETSSAALEMDRLEGTRFQVAGFSNLTQDHLDVHGTMEAYFEAKSQLFARLLAPGGAAVAMVDDDVGHGEAILGRAPRGSRVLRVSVRKKDADVAVLGAKSTIGGLRATLATPRGTLEVSSAVLLGEYNLANIALSVAMAEGMGIPHDAIAKGIARLPGVPGRVERVASDGGLDIFVDYAHTPDALERVIHALRPLTKGRLIVVFGCGGDRDRTKRPLMGAVVVRHADLAVVTSDNPRTEEPMSIISMILEGMHKAGSPSHLVEPDRRKAILAAVKGAQPGDVVLIAGKGHEDYQILGNTKIHFDDREEAKAAIAALRRK